MGGGYLASQDPTADFYLFTGTGAVWTLNERAATRAIGDPHGDTKIEAERLLWRREDSFELEVLRPTVIYRPGDDKFLPKLVESLRSGEARIICGPPLPPVPPERRHSTRTRRPGPRRG